MSRILVTGANGFVGGALCAALVACNHSVTGLVRRAGSCAAGVQEWVDGSKDFADLATEWPLGFSPDCVVHLAARVHVMHDDKAYSDSLFRATNVEGTLRLAEAALRSGARRFLFISSIKAVSEIDPGRGLREDDIPAPQDAYGRTKLAAERALVCYGKETGLDVVIVRPPLVYGPGVRANFLRLLDGVWKGIPLPLGMVDARRSLIYVDNLVDALLHCATDPRAAGQCFHVADGDDLTVAQLVRSLGRHLQRPVRMLPVPVSWLRVAGRWTGRSSHVDRLIGNLRVDTTQIRTVLNWHPPNSIDDGLAATARWYRRSIETSNG